MSWKSLPYWLKGGVIAIVINIILIFLSVIFNPANSFESPAVLLTLFQVFITQEIFNVNNLPALTIISSISFFIIGAIIGLIVQKIKKE